MLLHRLPPDQSGPAVPQVLRVSQTMLLANRLQRGLRALHLLRALLLAWFRLPGLQASHLLQVRVQLQELAACLPTS